MQDEGSFTVEVDEEKQQLYLKLDGMLDEDTAHAAAEAVIEGADRLEPGFGTINDISTFKPLSQEATDAIERGKAGLAERGVGAVVRVVGDSVVGKMQFDRVGEGEESYQVATAESREQAEQFLDRFPEDEPD